MFNDYFAKESKKLRHYAIFGLPWCQISSADNRGGGERKEAAQEIWEAEEELSPLPLLPRLLRLRRNVHRHPPTDTCYPLSVTIIRAFARKGKLKIFVRAQKNETRAMRELRFFSRFLKSILFLKKISKNGQKWQFWSFFLDFGVIGIVNFGHILNSSFFSLFHETLFFRFFFDGVKWTLVFATFSTFKFFWQKNIWKTRYFWKFC